MCSPRWLTPYCAPSTWTQRHDRGRVLPRCGVDLDRTLGALAMLPGDPTLDLRPGRLRRATTTPQGPAVLEASWDDGDQVTATTWGDGAGWLLDRTPRLLGLEDARAAFRRPARRRFESCGAAPAGIASGRPGRCGTTSPGSSCSSGSAAPTPQRSGADWSRRSAPTPPVPRRFGCPPSLRSSAGCCTPTCTGSESSASGPTRSSRRRGRCDGWRTWSTARCRRRRCARSRALGRGRRAAWPLTPGARPTFWVEGDHGIPSRISWLLSGIRRGDDAEMRALLEP